MSVTQTAIGSNWNLTDNCYWSAVDLPTAGNDRLICTTRTRLVLDDGRAGLWHETRLSSNSVSCSKIGGQANIIPDSSCEALSAISSAKGVTGMKLPSSNRSVMCSWACTELTDRLDRGCAVSTVSQAEEEPVSEKPVLVLESSYTTSTGAEHIHSRALTKQG